MGIRDWLAIIVIIFIVLILLDGFRRKWQERKTRIRVKLDKNIPPDDGEDVTLIMTKSELPNGGARIKPRSSGDVPVLMDSVDVDSEDIEEYARPAAARSPVDEEDTADTAWEDDWDEEGEDDWEEATATAGEEFDEELPDGDADDDVQAGDDGHWSATDDFDMDDDVVPDPPRAVAAKAGTGRSVPGQHGREKGRESGRVSGRESGRVSGREIGRLERIEPTFGNDDMTFSRDDQGQFGLENNELFETDEEDADTDAADTGQTAEVIIINVMAKPGTAMEGARLLPVLMKHGMRLGEMSIFHRHADNHGKGPVMFSMANMLKPGTFSMSDMETFTTPGVSFFMQLPNKLGNMQCFEQMLKTAQAVKEELDAVLKDENRSVFTRQTIEHSRQRIRDFELEMLARK